MVKYTLINYIQMHRIKYRRRAYHWGSIMFLKKDTTWEEILRGLLSTFGMPIKTMWRSSILLNIAATSLLETVTFIKALDLILHGTGRARLTGMALSTQ